MFQFLRKLIVPIIITVLVFFVAMIILEWGLEFGRSNQFRQTDAAAVINGESVSWQVYNNLYNNLYQTASRQDTAQLTSEQEKQIQQRAWNQLVYEKLLVQQAEKYGIQATEDEVYQYLRSNPPEELQQFPQFQTNGQFDYQKYFMAMTSPENSSFWASVEPIIRNDLKKLKMQEYVVQTAQVSEDEVRDRYMALHEQIKVGAVVVSYDRFTVRPPQLTDDQLHAYFNEHKDEYKLPDRASLNVVLVEKAPSDRDWDVAFQKLKAIHDSIASGQVDFETMAKRYSQDASKDEGGDLGWFTRGTMVPEFDRFSFSMKKGELSEPFRTQFGWHIILHKGYKEEKETPPGKSQPELVKRANVAHILIKVAPSQETIDKAYEQLNAFIKSAKASGFQPAADAAGLQVRATTPFPENGNIQYLGRDLSAGSFAFANDVNAISPVMENNSSVFVVQVTKRLPAGDATYEEAAEKVHVDALRAQVKVMCSDTIKAIYAEMQNGAAMDAAARAHGATYQEYDNLIRTTVQRPFSGDQILLGTAFGLTDPGQISKPVDYAQGSAIVKLLDRRTPNLADYNSARDSLYTQLLNAKRQEVYSNWYENLLNTSEIENNVERANNAQS